MSHSQSKATTGSATDAAIKRLQGEIEKLSAEIRESSHARAKIDDEMNSIQNTLKGNLTDIPVNQYLQQKEELRKAKESVIKLQRLVDLQNQLAALEKKHLLAALPADQDKRQKLEPEPVLTPTPLLIDKYAALKHAFSEKFEISLLDSIIQLPKEFVASGLKVGSVLGLDFLNPLRRDARETFIPEKVFVRESMKMVFDKFRQDATMGRPDERHTVLIGSPGVGKSVLFFLASLDQARSSPIVYLRKTKSESEISVFLMVPIHKASVRVLFTRKLQKNRLTFGLVELQRFFDDFLYQDPTGLSIAQHYYFVDGPRHTDLHDTFDGGCDYFCTPGGHPIPKQEQYAVFASWVLSGWTKIEAIEGLKAVCNAEPQEAEEVFHLCGGSIGNMMRAFRNFGQVKRQQDRLLSRLSDKEPYIAVRSMETKDNEISYDRIRTMFEAKHGKVPVQIVDSMYILNKLSQRISLNKWLEAYKLGEGIRDGTFRDISFERCIHRWFTEVMPAPIQRVWWSEGSTMEGIDSFLNDPDVYWIPSVPNFPNIDSAIVVGKMLYVLQMTCKVGQHNFNPDTFFNNFVNKVQKLFNNTLRMDVTVIVVVPMDCDPGLGCHHENLITTVHRVDTSCLAAFDETMKKLPFLKV